MSNKNDGGSADYYELPAGARELQDLIEHKEMNFAVGNIFKAAYRLGAENALSNRSRDLRKIMWFAQRELDRITPSKTSADFPPLPPAEVAAIAGEVDLSLPSIVLEGDEQDVWAKYKEEYSEWQAAAASGNDMDRLIEHWDIIQALQTHRERGGHSPATYSEACGLMKVEAEKGFLVMEARRQMLLKNATRLSPHGVGYYSPEVCAKIIATDGREWRP